MKKTLNPKIGRRTYWKHSSEHGRHFIGTEHVVISVQHVPDKLRQIIAGYGLFEPNKAISGGESKDFSVDVDRIVMSARVEVKLEKTPYLYTHEKTLCRVFLKPDGTQVYVNDTYVTEIEKFFGENAWYSAAEGQLAALVYGKARLGLVLPVRVDNDNLKVVRKQ